jgi:hypothetical protein
MAKITSKRTPKPKSSPYLVNKLTVEDARKIMRLEGGALEPMTAAIALISIVLTGWLSARAIWVGSATVWHLLLPLLAQYFALLLALPIFQAHYRLPAVIPEVRKCWWSLGVIVGLLTIGVLVSGMREQRSWLEQLGWLWNWVVEAVMEHEMHWPMLSAMIGFFWALPGRFRNCRDEGPPFIAVNLGCGAKAVILLVGCFLLPLVLATPRYAAWWLWGVLLLGELLAFGMILDIQRRLRLLPVEPKPIDKPVES